MFTFDDMKVAIAAAAGLLNWAASIDIVVQLAISIASLIYIVLKIRDIVERREKGRKMK